ncbi:MAG: hypothetical protein OXC40_01945 [Proteobacteria bacterium]|nr:hypothetical protein [Pseudomonadota bacterium]
MYHYHKIWRGTWIAMAATIGVGLVFCLVLGCRMMGSVEPSHGEVKYAHDHEYVMYFKQHALKPEQYYFVVCLLDSSGIDNYNVIEESCINGFYLQDDSPVFFTLKSVTDLKPTVVSSDWDENDLTALHRLKKARDIQVRRHQLSTERRVRNLPGTLGRTGLVTFLSGSAIQAMVGNHKIAKSLQAVGGIIMVAGLGVYGLTPEFDAKNQPVPPFDWQCPSCPGLNEQGNSDTTYDHPQDKQFRKLARNIKDQYNMMPIVVTHWPNFFQTTTWKRTGKVNHLLNAVGLYLNQTLFHYNSRITKICLPVSDVSQFNTIDISSLDNSQPEKIDFTELVPRDCSLLTQE